MNPKGHIQPQNIRPINAPPKRIMPITRNGKMPCAKNWPIAPIGQAKAAAGQAQQFNTGMQTLLTFKKYGFKRQRKAACVIVRQRVMRERGRFHWTGFGLSCKLLVMEPITSI